MNGGCANADDARPVVVTLWRELFDPVGERREVTWSKLGAELSRPRGKPLDPEHPALGGWSPASFENHRRAKETVIAVTALVLDDDSGKHSALALRHLLSELGVRAFVHATRRFRPSAPRWRIVLQTSRAMTPEEHGRVWMHMRTRLFARGVVLDQQTKDASRFWFLPCEPAEGTFIFESIEGAPLDVDGVLAEGAPPPKDATERKEQVHRAEPPELAWIPMSTRKRRARAYLDHTEPAISGAQGHKVAMRIVTAVVRGFALDEPAALEVLEDWNARCKPPWSAKELAHKISDAERVGNMVWGEKLLRPPRAREAGAPRPHQDERRAGHEDAPDDGDFDGPPPDPDRPFERGDHVELAHRLVDHLAPDGELVFDELHLWQYDGQRGLWAIVERAHESRLVQRFAGIPVGEKGKPLKLTATDVAGAIKLGHDRVTCHGFFAGGAPGLAFSNGFLRVSADGAVLLDHAPEHRVRSGYPFAYAPGIPHRFLKFLHDIFRDDDDRGERCELVQEFFGACLFGIAPAYQRCLVALGEGSNGKSRLADIMMACMPEGTVSAIPPQEWGQEYRRALLVGKRLNAVMELPESDIIASEAFKAIVTGDVIVGRIIREMPAVFRPIAGHYFAANKLPGTADQTEGFWRRFVMLTFNRSFENDPERDPDIAKTIVREELPEILSWLVEGTIRLMRAGKYTMPPSHDKALADWRLDSNQVAMFRTNELRDLPPDTPLGAWALGSDLYAAYTRWASANGHRAMASNTLAKRMKKELGLKAEHSRRGNRYPVQLLTSIERAKRERGEPV